MPLSNRVTGRDLVGARTEYSPIPGSVPSKYLQPVYTAQLLSQIAAANRTVLEQLQTRLEHTIPGVRTSKPITLYRLAEIGAADSSVAWTVFQALWKELMLPTEAGSTTEHGKGESVAITQRGPERQPLHPRARPPVLLTADNLTHLLVPTEYQTVDRSGKLSAIHPFDFTLIDHYMTYLSGQGTLTNGGMILASTCASDGRVSDSLNVAKALWEARQKAQPRGPLAQKLPPSYRSSEQRTILIDNDIGGLASSPNEATSQSQLQPHFKETVRPADQDFREYWSPWRDLDTRVMDTLKAVEFIQLGGMNKDEARRIIDYWAGSGMVRRKVDEGWMGEKWTLAGGGVIGELEKSVVRSVS